MGAGKWIGGVLGFITGGPLGALAGYALGSLFEHGLNEVNRQDTGQQEKTAARDNATRSCSRYLFLPLTSSRPTAR